MEDYHPLLERLQNRVDSLSNEASIRLRMGVRPWTEGIEPVLLFDQATAACSLVRRNYMRNLMVYDEEMRRKEILEQRLINDLKRAVEERELKVYITSQSIISRPTRLGWPVQRP